MKKIVILIMATVLTLSVVISANACATNTIAQGDSFDRSKITIQQEKQTKTGDINWTLVSVEDLGTQIINEAGIAYPATVGKFVYISFSVENIGSESKTLFDLRVIDDTGRIYNICNQAYGYFITPYSACVLEDILPNAEPRNFSATFDVDLDSKGLILETTDLLIPPQDVSYIDLGV